MYTRKVEMEIFVSEKAPLNHILTAYKPIRQNNRITLNENAMLLILSPLLMIYLLR